MLGRQLADDERGVGHSDRHHDNGKRLGVGSQDRNKAQEFLQPFRERGAAENSRQGRGGGKADLNGSQHARRIVGEREGNLRSWPPFLGQAFQVRAARGDDGKLGHGEEAVEHEQRQDDDDFNDQHFVLSRQSMRCG